MSAPLVSIVMPAYNAEATLQDSISSVLAQTLPDWELLLVVDCKSADSTRTLAEKAAAKESRIRLITDLTEGGCVFNRNEAIARATGEFIAFLDSDDLWMPEKLQKQVSHMQQTGSGLSYTGYKQMDWEGNLLNHIIQPPPRLTHSLLLHDNLLGCLTAMLRRSRHGGERFVEHLHEDYILWLKLLRQEDALGLPEPPGHLPHGRPQPFRQQKACRHGTLAHFAELRKALPSPRSLLLRQLRLARLAQASLN
jgi:teichuronic acid biosynthesis glycosyltransferase TuaG